jgi:hypothetical protein
VKVGFSVTKTWGTSASYTFSAPDENVYVVYAYKVMKKYSFEIHHTNVCSTDLGNIGTGFAKKYDHLGCDWYRK